MAFHIGYKNLLTDSDVTVTASSEATGYEKENAYDGFGFDWWKPTATGESYLQLEFATAKTADYVAIWGHNLLDHSSTYKVESFGGSDTWSLVGTGLAITGVAVPAITALNSTDIAFIDDNDELRTYRWNGSTWSLVGTGLAIPTVGLPSITALNSTDIAFIDSSNDELRTYRWNSSTWSLVGTGLAIPTVGLPSITALNSTDIAFIDDGNDELRTYRWNGSTWSLVGTGLAITGVAVPAITALNSTDIAFIDDGNDELRTYRWNSSTWSLVGTGLAITGVGFPAITALNSTDIAFIDSNNDELRTYRWNGSTWSLVGTGLAITGVSVPSITALNSTDIAFIDATNDELRTYSFDAIAWSDVFAAITPTSNDTIYKPFTSSTNKRWRVTISSASTLPSIAGIQIGETLEMPNNAEVGFAVPTIAPTIKTKTARSESGAFIGGSQLSQGIEGSISFTNIDPAFVRSDWEPFIEHVQTPAVFVIAWDTVTYTDEIMLAWADGDVAVPNYSSPLYMNFSLKFEGTK